MKKLYTLLLALLAVGAVSARELTFYQGNTPVAPGSTVYFADYEVNDIGGGHKEVIMHPNLFIGSDIFTNTVSVTATCTSGQEIGLCIGGACQAAASVTQSDITLRANNPIDVQYKWNNYDLAPGEEIPTITSTITAVDTKHPETEVTITVVMGPNASGINEIQKDKAVTWTPQGLEYNINGVANISIYSITGTQVMAVKADGRGSVSTHSLRPGIYIYNVQGDGIRQTGKIQVR